VSSRSTSCAVSPCAASCPSTPRSSPPPARHRPAARPRRGNRRRRPAVLVRVGHVPAFPADLRPALRHRVRAAGRCGRAKVTEAVAHPAAPPPGPVRHRPAAPAAVAGRDPDRLRSYRPGGGASVGVAATVGRGRALGRVPHPGHQQRGSGPLLVAGLFLLGAALVRYGVVEYLEEGPVRALALLGLVFAAGAAAALWWQIDAATRNTPALGPAMGVAGLLLAGLYVCAVLL